MKWYRIMGVALAVLMAGLVAAGTPLAAEKRLMMVFTTDTYGELNPCG
jgi:hypothetical protein